MKFLVDAQLPPRLCHWIKTKGYEARHVMEIEDGLTIPDASLWEVGKKAKEIIVSKDRDFFEFALLKGAPPPILYIALGNCSNEDLIENLTEKWEFIESSLEQGAVLVSVEPLEVIVFD